MSENNASDLQQVAEEREQVTFSQVAETFAKYLEVPPEDIKWMISYKDEPNDYTLKKGIYMYLPGMEAIPRISLAMKREVEQRNGAPVSDWEAYVKHSSDTEAKVQAKRNEMRQNALERDARGRVNESNAARELFRRAIERLEAAGCEPERIHMCFREIAEAFVGMRKLAINPDFQMREFVYFTFYQNVFNKDNKVGN
jgi:hypothetical protein